MDMEYAVTPMSIAHTFGNMTSFMTEFIRGMFQQNYFKFTNISTTIAYRYFNMFDNTNKEFIKRKKPMLIIRPRVDFNDRDVFLNGTFLTSRITDNYSTDLDFGNLQPMFSDLDNNIKLSYLLNRIKMYFDVTMVFESQMEQMNQMLYLKNRIKEDHPSMIHTALENNIPRVLMESIAKDVGIDINNTREFLDYMNSKSFYPITYKLKNSTGNDEFFRYYPVEVDTMFTNLNMDDGSKKGMVSDTYNITFTVSTEFFVAGMYYYFTANKQVIDEIQFSFKNESKTIIPFFTISNLMDVTVPPGWTIYDSPMFKVSHTGVPDTLEIGDLLNTSINSVIDYHTENGIPYSRFINIVVMRDNARLNPENGDYSMDFENRVLTINRTNTVSTYRMIILINVLYVNELISDLFGFDQER